MKIGKILMIFLSLWVMNALGCGFGGFSESSSETAPSDSDPATDTKLKGVVSKGLFKGGTVKFYAINSDGSETWLKTASIGAFGNYSASLSSLKSSSSASYSGIVMIKATGSYSDEATGSLLSIDDSNPLRAIVANPSTKNISVTPLTELAVRKALAVLTSKNYQLTATDVSEANVLVSEMFKVDIISTKPVEPNLSAEGFGTLDTSQAQKDYTLALAAISQSASSAGALSNTLNALADDILDGAMTAENAAVFQSALTSFLVSNNNQTGIQSINSTNLVNAGGAVKSIRIGTAEKVGAGSIMGGLLVTVKLPPGVRITADLTDPARLEKLEKEPLSGVVKASGVIAAGTYILKTSYLAPSGALPAMVTLALASKSGFPAGEFVTVRCDVPAGVSLDAAAFSIYKNVDDINDPKNFRAVDGNGAAFPADMITVEILPD